MAIIGIPEVINDFNIYNQNSKLVGVSGEVSLPDLEGMTETISGTGILGEYDAVSIGRYGAIELEVPFRCVDPDFFNLIDPSEPVFLRLRGAIQYTVKATGASDYIGMQVVAQGKPKNIAIGTIKQGGPTDSTITIESFYYYVELDGKAKFELHKLNGVYKINGKDLLSKIKQLT